MSYSSTTTSSLTMASSRTEFSSIPEEDFDCMVCKEMCATSYCFTCVRTMCDKCYMKHSKTRHFKKHLCSSANSALFATLICDVHSEWVEAYCSDCCVAVCKTCLLSTHSEHETSDFVLNSANILLLGGDITQKREVCEGNLKETESVESLLMSQVKEVDDEIMELQQKLHSEIDKQVNTLRLELQTFKAESLKKLIEIRKQNQEAKDLLQRLEDLSHQLITPLPEAVHIGLKNITGLLGKVRKQLPDIDKGIKSPAKCHFTPFCTEISFGQLYYEEAADKHNRVSPKKTRAVPYDVKHSSSSAAASQTIRNGARSRSSEPIDSPTGSSVRTSSSAPNSHSHSNHSNHSRSSSAHNSHRNSYPNDHGEHSQISSNPSYHSHNNHSNHIGHPPSSEPTRRRMPAIPTSSKPFRIKSNRKHPEQEIPTILLEDEHMVRIHDPD